MTPVQRRNELAEADESWSYEVFGKFGMDEEDNGYDDTRKVPLTELLKNVDTRHEPQSAAGLRQEHQEEGRRGQECDARGVGG